MTEKEMWEYLAHLWDAASPFQGEMSRACHAIKPIGTGLDRSTPEMCFGLCQSIIRLEQGKRITGPVQMSASKRLHAFLAADGWNGAYHWGLDAAGAKARAARCRKFAADCSLTTKGTK